MFFQSQAFPTEKKSDFVWLFLISKKSQRCSKNARIFKSGFEKAKLATLVSRRKIWSINTNNNDFYCRLVDHITDAIIQPAPLEGSATGAPQRGL